jgi:hypothetical protein
VAVSRLSILVYPESGIWSTARCLEHDVEASGRSADTAIDALLRMIRAHVEYDTRHNRVPLSAFRRAPEPYWRAFRGDAPHWVFDVAPWAVLTVRPLVDVAIAPENPAIRAFLPAAQTA